MRYEAERLYYDADRRMKDADVAPRRSRADVMKSAAAAYGRALEYSLKALDSISSTRHPVEQREVRYLAFQSANRLASLFFRARNFDTCVTILSRVLAKTSLEGPAQVTTTIGLGRALQASDNWDSALTVYQTALEYHYPPVDDSGEIVNVLFKLPLHIFQVTNAVGDPEAPTHYQKAEQYYQSLIELDQSGNIATAAHSALAHLYYTTEAWSKVIEQLRLLEETSDKPMEIKLKIGDIYARMPDSSDRAAEVYQSLLAGLKPADSAYRPRLRFKIALMKMDQAKYREARDRFIDIKREHPRFYAVTPLLQFSIARAFELLDRWNRAETEYKYLIEKYRGSEQAMATYLYLGDHYRELGREDEAQKRYREAKEYFDEMIARGAGTMIEARALAFKADLYGRWDDYEESVQLLTTLFERFPDTDPGRSSLLKAATVCRDRLNQPQRADSLVGRLRSMLLEPEEGWGT